MNVKAMRGVALVMGFGAGLTLLSTSPPVRAGSENEELSLTGSWELDAQASDDRREKMRGAMGDPGARGRPGPRGGGRSGRGMGRGGRDFEPMRQMRELLREVLRADRRLEIRYEENELVIVDGQDEVSIYYVDGHPHQRQTPSGVELTARCERIGQEVIIEETTERGVAITRTLVAAPDPRTLIDTVELTSRRFQEPVVLRRVYRAVRKEDVEP